jgi:hypothetical protein
VVDGNGIGKGSLRCGGFFFFFFFLQDMTE